MIARRWRGWADGSTQADAYVAYFEGTVRPQLERTDGFLDATLERVQDDRGRTEVIVVTRWTSMDAIHGFAGDEVDLAVVEPEARAVLSAFDTRVRHIELADGDAFGHLEVIDIPAEAAAHEPWFNETLTSVNSAVHHAWPAPGMHRAQGHRAPHARPTTNDDSHGRGCRRHARRRLNIPSPPAGGPQRSVSSEGGIPRWGTTPGFSASAV
jgi:heme-degrading monooxygenase HmoA